MYSASKRLLNLYGDSSMFLLPGREFDKVCLRRDACLLTFRSV